MKTLLKFVVALFVLGGAYYVAAPYLQPVTPETPEMPETKADVKVTTAQIQEDSSTYTIDVSYPQFGIPAIDTQIKKAIDDTVTEFKTLSSNPDEPATPKLSFDASFDSVYVGPDVVSVKLILSQYTGGAHPLTLISGLNYDRTTGKQLLQNDAFEMLGMTIEQVSTVATAELKAKLGDSMFEEGTNTNSENFSSFVISADEVTFIFQQYQTAAYAAGPQEVSFDKK